MTRKYIQITTLLTLVMVFSLGTAQARGKYPGPGQFKSQRGQARMMAKQLRKAGLPMNVVLAPLRIVRSGHKINKVKSGQLKLQENGVLPTKGTWTMSATKGQLAYLLKGRQQTPMLAGAASAELAQGAAEPAPILQLEELTQKGGGPGVWPWITGGVGLALVATGIPFTIKANSEDEIVQDASKPTDERKAAEDAVALNDALAYALYGTGGALVITSVVLFFVLDDSPSDAAALPLVQPTHGGAVFGLIRSF